MTFSQDNINGRQEGKDVSSRPGLLLLVDSPPLPREILRDSACEVVRTADFHSALGEIITRMGNGSAPAPVVISPAGRLEKDARAVTTALHSLDPRIRVFAVTTEGIPVDRGSLESSGINVIPAPVLTQPGSLQTLFNEQPAASPDPEAAVDAHAQTPADETDINIPAASSSDAVSSENEINMTATAPVPTVTPAEAASEAGAAPEPAVPSAENDINDLPEPPLFDYLQEEDLLPGLADEGLAELLVRKPEAVSDACLSLLRRRIGVPALEFLPGDAPVPDDPAREIININISSEPGKNKRLAIPAGTRSLILPWVNWLSRWLKAADHVLRLTEEAYTDPLTGAWNRRYLERYLRDALANAHEHRYALTLMVFDVDDLKSYNDNYGHEAGDEVLIEAVRLLKSVIRPDDRVCRIGGDEFVVVFYDPHGPRDVHSEPPRSAAQIVQRFQKQIAESRFPKLGHQAPGRLSVSGGLATYPWDGLDAAALLRAADERAMAAKRQGKSAIIFGPTCDQ
ncbi:MAG TPA: GGDEF domain-containing protein [Phycisphaeraceae bacterium]|nr:GGDEF domain-containing protein [Phycisphaeraceae bacterium]